MNDIIDKKYSRMENLLDKHDVIYEFFHIRDDSYKFVIEGVSTYIEYYPDTGVWESRTVCNMVKGKSGFGLRSLINYVTIRT